MIQEIGNERESFGIGCIALPEGVNRESFVASCFNNEQFAIITNNGELILNVPVVSEVLNRLEIPEEYKQLGTQILFLNIQGQNKPIIINVLSKKALSEFRIEGDFKLTKEISNKIGLAGNSKLSILSLFVKNSLKKIAKLILQVAGDSNSELVLESSGYIINRFATGFKIQSEVSSFLINKEGFVYTDGLGNSLRINKDNFLYKDSFGNKLTIDDTGYKLGNINFADFNTDLLNYFLSTFQVNTAYGPSGFCKGTAAESKLNDFIEKIKNINE